MAENNIWLELAEYARWAPSPHNTQPTRIKVISSTSAELFFLKNRGLNVGDPAGRFTYATFGIFAEILKIAAAAKGYELKSDFNYSPLYQKNEQLEKIATLTLAKKSNISDLDPQLIFERRTSRLAYNSKEIPEDVKNELSMEAERFGHSITFKSDKNAIKWTVELNKDSLFYDLSHKSYREELRKWLRYSTKEADEKKDGLDMESMQISGKITHSFMYQYWIYTSPIIRNISEFVYKNSMRGISTIAWIQGPYKNPHDWIEAGRLMIRLWLIATKHGVYWQPYGSVITNDEARKKLIEAFHIRNENNGENMVWLLLRIGYSKLPPKSRRLPVSEIIL